MKIEKVENLVANLHHKTEYIIHTTNLKQALNHRLVFEKVHRMTKFNQNSWPKPYIDTNKDLRKQSKMIMKKTMNKFMNNAFFGKTMENLTNIGILNWFQQKEEGIIYYQNQIIILRTFSHNFY